MIPARLNLEAKKGATYSELFTLKDSTGEVVNLTGYAAAMQVRDGDDEDAAILATFTTANGKIVLGGVAGTVAVAETAANMALLTPEPRIRLPGIPRPWYDLKLTAPGGTVDVWLEGEFRITERVTV